jgi:hypothetical protein
MKQPLVQPPLITYNLKERGRQHRGQERNFNIPALCASINGEKTQEVVKTRAMIGYYGHLARVLLNFRRVESAVIKGQYTEIEPALVTTHLKAYPDGTIEHQTEFLDTPSGRKASRAHANRIGGFSSHIDPRSNELVAYDYVLEQNFLHNKGYALDSASMVLDDVSGCGMTLDQVVEVLKSEEEESLLAIIEQRNMQLLQMSQAFDSVTAENEELLSMLATHKPGMVLDSAGSAPLVVTLDSANRIRRDVDFFNQTARLPGFIEPINGENAKVVEECNALIERIRHA